MMNLLTGVNGQLPVKGKQSAGKADFGAKKHLETDKPMDKSDVRYAAKEMESLFAFQMLKVMRETSESMAGEKKGNGYNTYMSMFDTEISKVLAERGMGLQDSIVRWLERGDGVDKIDSNNHEKSQINHLDSNNG